MFWDHATPERDSWSPNPRFIALHAGISHVLHMGASSESEVFAQILDKFDRAAGGSAGVLGILCINVRFVGCLVSPTWQLCGVYALEVVFISVRSKITYTTCHSRLKSNVLESLKLKLTSRASRHRLAQRQDHKQVGSQSVWASVRIVLLPSGMVHLSG
jgi:hypothetical protein